MVLTAGVRAQIITSGNHMKGLRPNRGPLGRKRMLVSAKRMAVLREHIRAESEHDMDALLGGMTPDCFNDVVGVPKPFVGPEQTAERYRKHWEGFPDFTVRVRRVLCADGSCVVTENEWRGTHLGTFLGWPPTGKPVKIRAVVVWHFKGDDLWGETFFSTTHRSLSRSAPRSIFRRPGAP
jgi:steroid delta-isomerase-like uncharacterized protein